MNPEFATNWIPGIVVLSVGCLAAGFYLLMQRGKAEASSTPRDGELEDLERRYQSRIEQLKELGADKHTLAPERYEAERTRLEQEAVAALRARDERLQAKEHAAASAPRPAPAPAGFLSPQVKGALWGGGIVLFFGLLGYTLVNEQHERGENESATGRVPPGAGDMAAGPMGAGNMGAGNMAAGSASAGDKPASADLQEAMERLRQNPADLDTAALVSHELIRAGMYEESDRVTRKALALDPFNVELRVHMGVLQAIRGDEEGAKRELLRLSNIYPDAQEGLLFLGALAMQQGDKATALESLERFALEVPSRMHPPEVRNGIRRLRAELGRDVPPASPGQNGN